MPIKTGSATIIILTCPSHFLIGHDLDTYWPVKVPVDLSHHKRQSPEL